MPEPWSGTLEWATEKMAFVDQPVPRNGVTVVEREPVLEVVKQLRDALDYARTNEVAGRHSWCDDRDVIDALEAARTMLAANGGRSYARQVVR
jgi:hypothetical protein